MDSIEINTPLNSEKCEIAWTNVLNWIKDMTLPSILFESIHSTLIPNSTITCIDHTNLEILIKGNLHLLRHFPIPKPPLRFKRQFGNVRFHAIRECFRDSLYSLD